MEKFIKVLEAKIEELKTDQVGSIGFLNAKHYRIIEDVENGSWASADEYVQSVESYNEVRAQIDILKELIEQLEEEELED
jgi:hypothetical protein